MSCNDSMMKKHLGIHSAPRNTLTTGIYIPKPVILLSMQHQPFFLPDILGYVVTALVLSLQGKRCRRCWITTAESSVLHDRAHNSCKSWSMASTTQEREEVFSGKMFFLVTLGSRNIHCGVALQRNPKTWYWQRQASCSWAFLPCNSTNQSIYTSFPCLPPHPCKYLRENTKSVSSRQRLERATGQLTMPIYIVSLPRITILQLALL